MLILRELVAPTFLHSQDPKRTLQFKDQSVYISAMSHQTPVQLPRGRPRSFDTEAAVERAMGVFWSRGYHATALPDLLRATKLSRGSLYAAFGDKHSLFLRALDRYVANALTRMDIELDPPRRAGRRPAGLSCRLRSPHQRC
jgi:TetR/AcrR family transcriptional repressor of nem operon